jgi:response regulator NasT
MNRLLRIAIADDELDMRDYFQQILPLLGHQVISVARNGRELVELCATTRPDLVITDIKMPDMDGIEAAARIYKSAPAPVILVSAYHDPEYIARAEADHVLAYLVKPIKQADLEPAIGIAMRRFEQFQELRKETADLKQALEDRKIIEKAEGVLMKEGRSRRARRVSAPSTAGQRQESQARRYHPGDFDRGRSPRAAGPGLIAGGTARCFPRVYAPGPAR